VSGTGAGGSAGTEAAGAAGSGGARPTVTAAPGTTLVKVDAAVRHQTFEGWGTSLCWWANHVGGWSEAARNAVVDAVVNPTSGLGYNVFRYNIGGGENPDHEHMDEHREMPGFSPSAGTFDWDADGNQRAILLRIAETGTDVILEAFSNSPPYWMTKSGCASGSSDGSNNLEDDAYDAFADYLTEVVKHYRDTYGITFRTLEPLNEPNANWWRSNGTQEGCHFSPSNQETIIQAVAAQLSEKGLTDTTVSASDENSLDDAYENLRAFGADTLSTIAQMNVHSYAGSRRREMRDLAALEGKRLWQSESGPLNQSLASDAEAALFMAGRIITDLRELKPQAWVDWQVGDPSRYWASISLNDAQQSFTPLKRFYMHAGFSRFIRPGAIFIDVNDPNMVAAWSPDARSLILVVRNGDEAESRSYTLDLTSLPSVGESAEAYRTSRTEDLASLPNVAIEGYGMVVSVPAYSVTTFVVPTE
jgi:O-glycosyl hydrolase